MSVILTPFLKPLWEAKGMRYRYVKDVTPSYQYAAQFRCGNNLAGGDPELGLGTNIASLTNVAHGSWGAGGANYYTGALDIELTLLKGTNNVRRLEWTVGGVTAPPLDVNFSYIYKVQARAMIVAGGTNRRAKWKELAVQFRKEQANYGARISVNDSRYLPEFPLPLPADPEVKRTPVLEIIGANSDADEIKIDGAVELMDDDGVPADPSAILVELYLFCEPEAADLKAGLRGTPYTTDPHFAFDTSTIRAIENCHRTLLRRPEIYPQSAADLEPDLLDDWTFDGTTNTYTLTLKPDQKFHDGSPVTGDDVVFSLDRIKNSGVRKDHFADTTFSAEGDVVFAVVSGDVQSFPAYLADPMNAVVSKAMVEAVGGTTARVDDIDIGCGPFRWIIFVADERFEVRRSDAYNGTTPSLKGIEYRAFATNLAMSLALLSEEIDLICDASEAQAALLDSTTGIVVKPVAGTRVATLLFDQQGAAELASPEVRRAISLAINRDSIRQVIGEGQWAKLPGGPIASINPFALPSQNEYPYDPAEAETLLEQAGYPRPPGGGVRFTLEIIVDGGWGDAEALAAMVRADLHYVGIGTTATVLPPWLFSIILAKIPPINFGFNLAIGTMPGGVDPDEWFWPHHRSGSEMNYGSHADVGLDVLIDAGRVTTDAVARKAVYNAAQGRMDDVPPAAFLAATRQIAAWRDRVTGYGVRATGETLALRDVQVM
ncbi:MAG TPA: ABC transporter substrate-binding protein [Tepidisphaeraceae bacterium]|nr:ABC transporter substrate-binding protein [Tepidisphaeraceae bacterium]